MAWEPTPDMTLDEAFYEIPTKLRHDTWNRFARSALKLADNDIDAMTASYSKDAKEMKYRMLKVWQEQVGAAASVETAYAVLNHFLFPKVCPKPDLLNVSKQSTPKKGPKASVECQASVRPDAIGFVDDPPLANYCDSIEVVRVRPTDLEFYETTKQQTQSTYPLENRKGRPGCTFILNNMFSHLREQEGDRTGSERDLKTMKELWEQLGSEVVVHKDLSAEDIKKELINFSDYCDGYDYCTIFIMSHGTYQDGRGIVYGNDHGQVDMEDDILKLFNNVGSRHLHGIPKLFFFQCCRGDESDFGVPSCARPRPAPSTRADGEYASDTGPIVPKIPQWGDMLITYATQAGFQAYRNINQGSWFVNAIGNVFMRHAKKEHVVDLMTMVHDAVSTQTTDIDGGTMAMPEAKTTFRRKLYFYPGIRIGHP